MAGSQEVYTAKTEIVGTETGENEEEKGSRRPTEQEALKLQGCDQSGEREKGDFQKIHCCTLYKHIWIPFKVFKKYSVRV